jgi:hypothetical protein
MESTLQYKALRSNKPTITQTKVIAMYAQGKAKNAIAKELGIDYGTVGRILESHKVPEATSTESALRSAGITPESLARHAATGLLASEVKLASFEGKFTDEREVADHAARFRYFDATAKMLGMYPSESNQTIAQLIVRLPQSEIIKGHGDTCLCDECARAWESKSLPSATVLG